MTKMKESYIYLQLAARNPEKLPKSHDCIYPHEQCRNRMKNFHGTYCYVQKCPVKIDKECKSTYWSEN